MTVAAIEVIAATVGMGWDGDGRPEDRPGDQTKAWRTVRTATPLG